MEKEILRQQLRQILLKISKEQMVAKSRKACQNLIATPQFQNASTIMIHLSLPHEANTSDAILSAWQLGKTVAVPKVSWQQRHMIPVKINSLETGFSNDASGLRNPVTGVPIPLQDIDLVVTPGLGFDERGNRLGRGGAYYDRFFANPQLSAPKCGFAFSEQVIDSVPMTETDVPIDFLVTDEKVMYFDNVQGG